jgi:5-methylcytosine-specific restriction endonuclease McrA
MPTATMRFCGHCGQPHASTVRCPTCTKATRQRVDRARRDAPERELYRTERWKQASLRNLAQHQFCAGFPLGVHGTDKVFATCTDHIKPANQYPELFFDPRNHRSLCDACNQRKGSSDTQGMNSDVADRTGHGFA